MQGERASKREGLLGLESRVGRMGMVIDAAFSAVTEATQSDCSMCLTLHRQECTLGCCCIASCRRAGLTHCQAILIQCMQGARCGGQSEAGTDAARKPNAHTDRLGLCGTPTGQSAAQYPRLHSTGRVFCVCERERERVGRDCYAPAARPPARAITTARSPSESQPLTLPSKSVAVPWPSCTICAAA